MLVFAFVAAVLFPALVFPAGSPQEADGSDLSAAVSLLEFVLDADEATAIECLKKLSARVQSGELSRQQVAALRSRLEARIAAVLAGNSDSPLHHAALVLAVLWGDPAATTRLRATVDDGRIAEERRIAAVETLAAVQDPGLVAASRHMLIATGVSKEVKARLIAGLGRYDDPQVADLILGTYEKLAADLRPRAIGMLLRRPVWIKRVLASISQGTLSRDVIDVNQIRAMLASPDPEVVALATGLFGTVRSERNPQREEVIHQMRDLLARTPGNAVRGQAVFQRVCGQCHRLHGAGQEVGPDITSNGRASFEQLLSNVFDPSLVIGPAYQAVSVITQDGRVLTGLLVEDSAQRIVLKTQGGTVETIPRSEIEDASPSKLSLMPEGLEKQLTPAEIADLFALISLDRPPSDPQAQPIPGTPSVLPRAAR